MAWRSAFAASTFAARYGGQVAASAGQTSLVNETRLPRRSSPKASEVWWRRRESNPRPKAHRQRNLHAYPLLISRTRREEAAKTAGYQTRKVSLTNAEPPFESQPA